MFKAVKAWIRIHRLREPHNRCSGGGFLSITFMFKAVKTYIRMHRLRELHNHCSGGGSVSITFKDYWKRVLED